MKNVLITDVEMDAGDIIKGLRNDKGLTLKELAKRANVSESAVSRWENKNRIPTIDVFIRIVMALDHEVVVIKKRRGDEANPASKEV